MTRKKEAIILFLVLAVTLMFTGCAAFLPKVTSLWLKQLLNAMVYILVASPSIIAYKLQGGSIKRLFAGKKLKQLLFGIALVAFTAIAVVFIPLLFKVNLIGSHLEFSYERIISNLFFFLIFVGPIEEFIFRVYIQETFERWFGKYKVLAPLLSAALFGLWHIVNGIWIQVIITFLIGAIFGYAKYLFKNCTYLSVAVGHGLYNWFGVLVRMFLIA